MTTNRRTRTTKRQLNHLVKIENYYFKQAKQPYRIEMIDFGKNQISIECLRNKKTLCIENDLNVREAHTMVYSFVRTIANLYDQGELTK